MSAQRKAPVIRFIVFHERGPRWWWAQTDDGDIGAVFASGASEAKVKENVVREVDRGLRLGWLRANYGFETMPRVAFRPATRADHRVIVRQNAELSARSKEKSFLAHVTPDGRVVRDRTLAAQRRAIRAERAGEAKRIDRIVEDYRTGSDSGHQGRKTGIHNDWAEIPVRGWVEDVLRPYIREDDEYDSRVVLLRLLRDLYEQEQLARRVRKKP